MDDVQLVEASAYPATMYRQPEEILQNQQRMAEVLLRFAEPIPDDPPTSDRPAAPLIPGLP